LAPTPSESGVSYINLFSASVNLAELFQVQCSLEIGGWVGIGMEYTISSGRVNLRSFFAGQPERGSRSVASNVPDHVNSII
jgi:hypothetical protein